jgi:hypothetical protein
VPQASETSKKDAALPSIPKEIIDRFVSGPMTAEAANAASRAGERRTASLALSL